jgi:murein DD-endopeptidase MepM/ murein hydrolase activator NlpD
MPTSKFAVLLSLLSRQGATLGRWAQQHRRRLSAAGLALLAGYGITAFGIAPLAPDAADMPPSWVQSAVTLPDLAGQLEALSAHRLSLHRQAHTRSSDTADTLLRRLGANDPEAARWLRTDATARKLLEGRAGKMVSAEIDATGQVLGLVARFALSESLEKFQRLTVRRDPSGLWQSELETPPLERSLRLASGSIRSSLFAATDEAGLPDPIAVQMAEIFAGDIDFHRELRKGDSFSLVFESLSADGEPITWNQGAGRVLAAEFISKGRSHEAVWFGAGKGGYYDLRGDSKRRAFLASPMAFSRVTSGFAMRFHPVLQRMKAHMGVDYGAPVGTPVRSVGDGVVEFAGWQGGYGTAARFTLTSAE